MFCEALASFCSLCEGVDGGVSVWLPSLSSELLVTDSPCCDSSSDASHCEERLGVRSDRCSLLVCCCELGGDVRGEDEREASFSDSSAVRLFLFLGAIACPSACDGRLCGAMPTGSVVFLFFLDLFFRCAVLLAHALHSLRSPDVSVILSKVFTLVCVALFSSLREQVSCAGVSSVEV